MIENGIYFVSGIDTDAGKSFATGILARRILDSGKTCITQKFIQTGGENIDIAVHRKIMGIEMQDVDLDKTTCPVMFSYPASPHLAAKLDNRQIDFEAIENSMNILAQKYDVVLVEGAGGLHVPLVGLSTTIDWVERSSLPLIFVTSGKLGSINHTLLSLEVCQNRGIEVEAVVYNHFFDDDKTISEDTMNFIQEYLKKYLPETKFIEIPKL